MESTEKGVYILGIESSCDETSAAVCHDGKMYSNIIATQKIHEKYGGVVPELASRVHIQNIVPVVDTALKEAGCALSDIDAIAFTQAPGLIGSLLVGAQFAKSVSLAIDKPLIAVHHMQAHVIANLIGDQVPSFPFLCLTVSGGHTQIVKVTAALEMEVLGETIDDAAGEAFDKTAKILGLPYPGGPLIDKYAKQGNPKAYKFAEPQVPGLNFSFSGVKTSVLYFLQKQVRENPDFIKDNLADICASIQYTIIRVLMRKLNQAIKETSIKNVCIAGGVSANSGLRQALTDLGENGDIKTYFPAFEYCVDNAAMIAMTGFFKYQQRDFTDLTVSPSAKASW